MCVISFLFVSSQSNFSHLHKNHCNLLSFHVEAVKKKERTHTHTILSIPLASRLVGMCVLLIGKISTYAHTNSRRIRAFSHIKWDYSIYIKSLDINLQTVTSYQCTHKNINWFNWIQCVQIRAFINKSFCATTTDCDLKSVRRVRESSYTNLWSMRKISEMPNFLP